MHQTTNPVSLQWLSLLSSQPYVESYNSFSSSDLQRNTDANAAMVSMYAMSDGYFASKTLASTNVLYINGDSLSILASFSPSVYLSALVFILLLYSLHIIMAPTLEYSSMRLSWMPSSKPYVFGALVLYWLAFECNYVIFNNWKDFTWNEVLTVRYDIDGSSSSVFYSAVVLCLYAFHLCVKSGDCRDIFGNHHVYSTRNAEGKNVLYSTKMTGLVNVYEIVHGNLVSGPVTNDTTVLGALVLFLLSCGSIGVSRSIVLETEAQLIIACAFSIAAIEYLCANVCAYFWYVHGHYIHQDHMDSENIQATHPAYFHDTEIFNISQSIVLCRLTVFVQALSTIVNGLLLYILLAVLNSLRPFEQTPVWWLVSIMSGFYILMKGIAIFYQWNAFKFSLYEKEQMQVDSFKSQYETWHASMTKMRHNIFKGQEIITGLIIFVFIVFMYCLVFIPDEWAKHLRAAEKIQYSSLAESTGTVCSKGLQRNSIMNDIAGSTCAVSTDPNALKATWTYENDTPIDMKVYEWTRWWRPMQNAIVKNSKGEREECSNCQDVDTFFCASGFEFHFDRCAREYKRSKVRPVHMLWQEQVEKSYVLKLV